MGSLSIMEQQKGLLSEAQERARQPVPGVQHQQPQLHVLTPMAMQQQGGGVRVDPEKAEATRRHQMAEQMRMLREQQAAGCDL